MEIGPVTVKRAVKSVSSQMAILANRFSRSEGQAAILYYHRIADIGFVDPQIDDHNVTPAVFERQIAALSKLADIVPLTDLATEAQARPKSSRPVVSLTFDDGYENFVSNALPVLKNFNAPATLSVVTGVIDKRTPMPFDKWALKNSRRIGADAWQPISWRGIETCLESGLVSLGAHSHQHRKANDCSRDEIYEEVRQSADVLRRRFGDGGVPVYAYPYGNTHLGHVPEHYENAVRDAGFEIAVTTNHGHITSESNPFRLPRIEAHALDLEATLRAKIEGEFSPYHLHDLARSVLHRLKTPGL